MFDNPDAELLHSSSFWVNNSKTSMKILRESDADRLTEMIL